MRTVERPAAPAERAAPTARAERPSPRATDILAVVLLLGVVLVFHGRSLFGGPIFYERDTLLFYYPLTDWFAEQLRAGRFPLWTPMIFAGYPLVADGEIGPLYPPNLLLLLALPTPVAFVVLRALHSLVAALLMYGLLRTLRLGWPGAFLGALVFTLGSFLVGQLQHENMIRSAVWLPGEIWLLESAFRCQGWARQRRLLACGVLFALACLGLHIQAVAMSLLALGAYVLVRVATDAAIGPWRERLLLAIWAPGLVTALGVALTAAQWLPLFELGRTSYRGPGLRYDLATTYALAPVNLPALLFPYFFRGPDGVWWSLWAPWETLPYAGIAPLAIAPLGLLLATRRPPVWYFALLALGGLWIALAHYAPLNLHALLWQLPGFSSLRAPGRFLFLFVFGVAGLAAFGLDALIGRAGRTRAVRLAALVAGAGSLTLAAGLFGYFQRVTQRLLTDPGWEQQAVQLRYLSLPRQNPDLQLGRIHDGLLYSLSVANPKTALTFGLLIATGLLLLAVWRWPRRAGWWGCALAGLTSLDLLVFALDYHPSAPLDRLMAVPPVAQFLGQHTAGERVFAEPALGELEPNRLTLARAWDLNGYSSLQSQRHWEYLSSVDRQDNALLDIWNGRYYVVPGQRNDVVIVDGTAFRPYELLMSGGAGNPTGRERFRIEPFLTDEVRVLAALTNAIHVPQGATVAEITLVGQDGQQVTLPLRAGIDVSEHAIDRPDVAPLVAHARARVVRGMPETLPTGQTFTSNIYEAVFRLEPSLAVQEISVRYLASEGYLRLWGLGLVEPGSGRVRSLFADDKAKYEHPPLYQDERAVVYRNAAAFPRAFVVPEALARRTRTETTAIARMALQPFDPRRQVILEEGPFDDVPLAAEQRPDQGSDAPPRAARVEDHGTDEVLVTASGPGVLVLTDAYHRGWRAYLDGREVPVYLANYVARAVGLPAGEHHVRFVFDPLSWRLGRGISLAAALFVLACLAVSLIQERRQRRAL